MKKNNFGKALKVVLLCIAVTLSSLGSGMLGMMTEALAATYTYDQEFEDYLDEQGFPESYKDALRQLHAEHPDWVFVAFQTNLDWDTVIENEMTYARNLVPDTSSYPSSFKDTTLSTSFDWENNSWYIISSPYWVQASQAAVEYYMDPRNFLTEEYIFQFELLTYNGDVQNLEGVEKILEGTFMSGTIVSGSGTVTENETISSDTYTVLEEYICGLDYKTTVGTLLSYLTSDEGTLQVVDSSGTRKSSSDYVGTGDVVQVVSSDGVVSSCMVLLYGDLNGDGQVNSVDRTYLKMYVMGEYSLTEIQIKAGDVNQDGTINSVDRTYLKLQVNNKYTISQETTETGDLTYAEAFMKIAEQINVSPYMLASRVRQEQGVSGTSDLISGTYSGYEGYYNYFNISASGSTTAQIVKNGLEEAVSNGWDTPYKALLGGAQKLAENYILKGQDTLYLQKFDVEGEYYGYYWHQYMQNLLAATNEGYNVYLAYQDLDALDEAFVFKIPVYNNMPSTAAAKPTKDGNPNYKLKSLSVTGYTINFHYDTYDYYITVSKSTKSLRVSAEAFASTTSISGIGTITISSSTSMITVTTKAENGDTATYRIHLTFV